MTESPPAVGDVLWTIARPADEYIDGQPGRPRTVEITGEFEIGSERWYVAAPYSSLTGKVDLDKSRECECRADRLFDGYADALDAYATAMREFAKALRARADEAMREAWWANEAEGKWMSGN